MQYKEFKEEDYRRVFAAMLKMRSENVFSNFSVNIEKTMKFLKHIDNDPNSLGLMFSTKQDEVVGVFVGQVYPHFFSDDLVAVDQFLYVDPEFRRLGIAEGFIEEYREWAHHKGAKLQLLGASTGIPGAAELYEKLGYTRLGGNYGLW